MILPITLTLAGAAAILHIWLASRVSRLRRAHKVSVGDGANEAIIRRMRAHANYGENMPLFLILIALLEMAGSNPNILWGIGLAFILSRILHAFGMDSDQRMRLRAIGMAGTALILVGLAGWALSFAYFQPPAAAHETHIGAGRAV